MQPHHEVEPLSGQGFSKYMFWLTSVPRTKAVLLLLEFRLKRFRYIAEGDEMGVSVATPSECQGAELLLFCDLLLPLLSLLAIRVGSKNVLHLEEREEGYWIPAGAFPVFQI